MLLQKTLPETRNFLTILSGEGVFLLLLSKTMELIVPKLKVSCYFSCFMPCYILFLFESGNLN